MKTIQPIYKLTFCNGSWRVYEKRDKQFLFSGSFIDCTRFINEKRVENRTQSNAIPF